jgi:DNA polymerase III epsilon subunit-like protein
MRNDWVALDCETTGLDSRARLIEISAMTCNPESEELIFDSLVNPGIPVPFEITRLTGITAATLKEAPSREIVLRRFFNWLPSTTIVAHHARFDLELLRRESVAAGLQF